MSSILSLLILIPLCTALILVHPSSNHSQKLVGRAGQKVENLDAEPDYVDPITQAAIQKSRILTGVGLDLAEKRAFDWDETCTDSAQRDRITRTFGNAMQLMQSTSVHVEELRKGLKRWTPHSKDSMTFAFDKDPAFAQMLGNRDDYIDWIKDTYDLVKNVMPKTSADRGPKGSLRFICDKDGVIKNGKGLPACVTEGAQAMTLPPYSPGYSLSIEAKYSLENSWSIVFCPPYFDDKSFPHLDTFAQDSNDNTLDKVDCAERILIHEFMHLKWIRDMPGKTRQTPDYIGWVNCNKVATYRWSTLGKSLDNFAWYALYAYFNKGCGKDIWPQGTPKKVKRPK